MVILLSIVLVMDSSGVSVLAPGLFHDNEIKLNSDGEWFGLCLQDSLWELKPVELVMAREYDPIVDAEGEATGWRVLANDAEPIVMLRSDDSLFTPGSVHALFDQETLLSRGDEIEIAPGEYISAGEDSVAYIRDGVSQNISAVYDNLYGEGVWILWAGDLDGDGLTDLICPFVMIGVPRTTLHTKGTGITSSLGRTLPRPYI